MNVIAVRSSGMVRFNRRGLKCAEIWFDETVPARPGVDVVYMRQRPSPEHRSRCTLGFTLISDLTIGQADLFASFGSTNRYKIKRAESRDALDYQFFDQPLAQLESFCDFYDAFARGRALVPAHRDGLAAACTAGRLALSSVSRQGEDVVWHAYITGEDSAALLHSASHYRAEDKEHRAVIARANRWAHWRDMTTFKTSGLRCYDWGGMFADESRPEEAGINNFKREFGGVLERRYACVAAFSVKGRAFLAGRDVFHRLKSWHSGRSKRMSSKHD